MQAKQAIKINNRTNYETQKYTNKMVVDQYDSLNLLNMKQKQQQIICKFCNQQIPQRLMVSHKRVCVQAEKCQYLIDRKIQKPHSIKKMKKVYSSEVKNQSKLNKNQINNDKLSKRKPFESCNKGKQSIKKLPQRNKRNITHISQSQLKNKNIYNMANSVHVTNKSNLKKQVRKTNPSIKKQLNTHLNTNRFKQTTMKNNLKKNNITKPNTNNFRQTRQQNPRRNNTNNRQQTANQNRRNINNGSRRSHRRNYVFENITSQESFFQQIPQPQQQRNRNRRQQNSNSVNFMSHSINGHFSMLNTHFNAINEMFSNFSNLMPNIPNFQQFFNNQSQYYFQNPIQTMFFQYNGDSEQSSDNQQEEAIRGLDQEQLQNIPKRRYEARLSKQQQCTVCLSDIKQKQMVKNLTCAHIFHADCIDEWLRRKAACPVCREKI